MGRAIVQRLAEAGFAVAFTYLSSETQAQELHRSHQAYPIRADFSSDPTAVVQHIRNSLATFTDRLDVLINSASIYEPSSLEHTDLSQMRRLMSIHYEIPLLLAQSFASKLREARGHVVNMVDLLAQRPWPQYLAYCASKAALLNLTLGLARELAPEVTVNGIAPGVVAWADGTTESEQRKYLQRVPLGRAGTPQDVANLIHFLVTEGSYITGQILHLDGGRSIT